MPSEEKLFPCSVFMNSSNFFLFILEGSGTQHLFITPEFDAQYSWRILSLAKRKKKLREHSKLKTKMDSLFR